MSFIALDLETTGLSLETDTIIEIAAVRFDIIKNEIGHYNPIIIDERSMLVYPGREITQEISMITHITNDMLNGKPLWKDIKEKVSEFIGDDTIVGHNVIFDINMLKSHGIGLKNNTYIDTFELSEIFSQDAESLNLGFLANKYGLIDSSDAEHRALSDVKMSIRLFVRYLRDVQLMPEQESKIWSHFANHDQSKFFRTLESIIEKEETGPLDIASIFQKNTQENSQKIQKEHTETVGTIEACYISTFGTKEEEVHIIKSAVQKHKQIILYAPGYKNSEYMAAILKQEDISCYREIATSGWISLKYLEYLTRYPPSNRKELILIVKLIFWLLHTETGLIDELKFYGEERVWIDLFRCREDEYCPWKETQENKKQACSVIIRHLLNFAAGEKNQILIRDIALVEDIIRRKESQDISFQKIYVSLNLFSNIPAARKLQTLFSIIEGLYTTVPERPNGPKEVAPGAFGETYFFTQNMLWKRGNIWLKHTTYGIKKVQEIFRDIQVDTENRVISSAKEYILTSMDRLMEYHEKTKPNHHVILTITSGETKITYIPRNIGEYIEPILKRSIKYGCGICEPQIEKFLEREYATQTINSLPSPLYQKNPSKSIHVHTYLAESIIPGTIILTTSQKHARDMGQELRKIHGKRTDILIQGLSGGKGKMLNTFIKNKERTILIGIIDTWRDEYELWKHAHKIILAKLPFDPPTDPYFLARTVGMSNNFSEYSEPIVTVRINTLLSRIKLSGYTQSIEITDIRLSETEWGKRILHELI